VIGAAITLPQPPADDAVIDNAASEIRMRLVPRLALAALLALPLAACDGMNRTQQRALSGGAIGAAGGAAVGALTGGSMLTGAAIGAAGGAAIGALTTPSGRR
jgi:uncharacterized membrane protein